MMVICGQGIVGVLKMVSPPNLEVGIECGAARQLKINAF